MNKNALFYLRTGLLILFILIVIGYAFFQGRNIIFGPSISVELPLDGQTYTNPLIEIKGTAQNINYLSLDDRVIFTDKSGAFDEKIVLSPGYNVIKIDAHDKFGKKTEKIIRVIYKATEADIPIKSQVANPIATSTIRSNEWVTN